MPSTATQLGHTSHGEGRTPCSFQNHRIFIHVESSGNHATTAIALDFSHETTTQKHHNH